MQPYLKLSNGFVDELFGYNRGPSMKVETRAAKIAFYLDRLFPWDAPSPSHYSGETKTWIATGLRFIL